MTDPWWVKEDNESGWAGIVDTGLWFAAQQLSLQASIIGIVGVVSLYNITSRTWKEIIFRVWVSVYLCVHAWACMRYEKLWKSFKGKLPGLIMKWMIQVEQCWLHRLWVINNRLFSHKHTCIPITDRAYYASELMYLSPSFGRF